MAESDRLEELRGHIRQGQSPVEFIVEEKNARGAVVLDNGARVTFDARYWGPNSEPELCKAFCEVLFQAGLFEKIADSLDDAVISFSTELFGKVEGTMLPPPYAVEP